MVLDIYKGSGIPFIEMKKKPNLYERFATSKILKAITKVETGVEQDPNVAVGDQGESRGSLQIQEPYYKDAMEENSKDNFFPELNKASYKQATKDPELSKKLVFLYMRRYTPENLINPDSADSVERIAKIHNGGTAARNLLNEPNYYTDKIIGNVNYPQINKNVNIYYNKVLENLTQ
tara:strand:- start:964 stop:1494 length:531 start_codon:yes stop_codon:yes gene_type:complete